MRKPNPGKVKKELLSIVIPVYYNELNLEDTSKALIELAGRNPNLNFEFVFVNDGSGDNSLALLHDIRRKHPKLVRVISLSRNFGTMAAIQAGFSVCKGDYAGFIAADLQDPPELLIEMHKNLQDGTKVCLAVRSGREDAWHKAFLANIFYALLRKFALPGYPRKGFDYLLLRREVVDQINRLKEKNTNLMSLIFWMGYPFKSISYVRKAREKGKSRWTLNKRIKLVVDSFVGYSYFPIRLISAVGLLVSLGSFGYFVFMLTYSLMGKVPIQGWTTLVLFLAFFSGLQMLMLGILGEYVWRTLDEVRKRPNFIIDEEA